MAMPEGFTEAVNWIFSALLTASNSLFSVWLFQLFLSLGVLVLVWKIYNLLR